VIQPTGIAQAHGVRGGEQTEIGVRPDHAVLIEQGQLALGLQHALDHEHHVGPAGVIFVEHQSGRRLQRPGQQAFAELGDLLAVAQHDGIAADQIDTADMRIEVDADARPVQACGDLLDMRRLAGAVIALHHHAAIVGEPCQHGERGFRIEHIGRIEIGHAFVRLAERGHLHVDIDTEHLARVDHLVGRIEQGAIAAVGLGVRNIGHGIIRWSESSKGRSARSGEGGKFAQVRIGGDDLLQGFLVAAVTAIAIGMIGAHQLRIGLADRCARRICAKP